MSFKEELNTKELKKLCKKFNVKELYVFGSALSDDFSESSDIDLLVKFNRQGFKGAFDQFIDFKQQLALIFGRPVDLYHLKKFRNPLFQREIDSTKKLLYAA